MTTLSMNVTCPIYRHFMPVAQDLVIHTPVAQQAGQYLFISLKKQLIQGANPIDSKLVSRLPGSPKQFQGGYRCTIEVVGLPLHGTVRLSDNKLGLEYCPEVNYSGKDFFSYRLVNVMGQPSSVACVSLLVRI